MSLTEGKTEGAKTAEPEMSERAVAVEDLDLLEDLQGPDDSTDEPAGAGRARAGSRWWVVAAASALLLTLLTGAGIYLLTRKSSTVDELIILTVPSGAEVKLNSRSYGISPVKLEQLPAGTFNLSITKDGYEPIEATVTVSESSRLEYRLKLMPPPEFAALPPEELVKHYEQKAQEAFAQGRIGPPYDDSALSYVERIRNTDPNNEFAEKMRADIIKALNQAGREAVARDDLSQAKAIYNYISEYLPDERTNRETREWASQLEDQLARRGAEVLRELLRKAEDAFGAGKLIEPARSSAYYYSKQALELDRQNEKARDIRERIRKEYAMRSQSAFERGNATQAIRELEKIAPLYPEDKDLRAKIEEYKKADDPTERRIAGLKKESSQDFNGAIRDLEYAMTNNAGNADVLYALANSYWKTGRLTEAVATFQRIPPDAGPAYRSAIAAQGDIAYQRGDREKALALYKQARQLGGSIIYSIPILDDKIENIERRQREKEAEPFPVTITAVHDHGTFRGSCKGTLTVDSKGVRYESNKDNFSWSVTGVLVSVANNELIVDANGQKVKFKVARSEAERFREMVQRYRDK